MILPTKHIKTENALVGMGAETLAQLHEAKTVSRLFRDLQSSRSENNRSIVHFDWFLLTLDFLYAIGAIRYEGGLIRKMNQ